MRIFMGLRGKEVIHSAQRRTEEKDCGSGRAAILPPISKEASVWPSDGDTPSSWSDGKVLAIRAYQIGAFGAQDFCGTRQDGFLHRLAHLFCNRMVMVEMPISHFLRGKHEAITAGKTCEDGDGANVVAVVEDAGNETNESIIGLHRDELNFGHLE